MLFGFGVDVRGAGSLAATKIGHIIGRFEIN
jgi:hypothetical protein